MGRRIFLRIPTPAPPRIGARETPKSSGVIVNRPPRFLFSLRRTRVFSRKRDFHPVLPLRELQTACFTSKGSASVAATKSIKFRRWHPKHLGLAHRAGFVSGPRRLKNRAHTNFFACRRSMACRGVGPPLAKKNPIPDLPNRPAENGSTGKSILTPQRFDKRQRTAS